MGANKRMLVCAINAINENNYIPHTDPGIDEELASSQTPLDILLEKENEILRKRKYKNLSSEAKQVMRMVFDAPTEIMSLIASPKTKAISKDRIERMLAKQWKDPLYASQVIQQIVEYVKLI